MPFQVLATDAIEPPVGAGCRLSVTFVGAVLQGADGPPILSEENNKLHRREIGQATQPDGCERICNKQHHSILCHRQEQSLNRLTSQTYRDLPKQNSNPG